MGGNLAWTLRLPDRTEYRMDHWTNTLPRKISHPRFFDGDPDHIFDAIEEWMILKDDWERNRESGAFEQEATEIYAPYPYGLRPSEYGVVVTDFVTRTILSWQGYTHFDTLPMGELAHGRAVEGINADRLSRRDAFIAAGRVAGYSFLTENASLVAACLASGGEVTPIGQGFTQVRMPGTLTLDQMMNLTAETRKDPLGAHHNNRLMNARMELDISPFRVASFPDGLAGLAPMRRAMTEIGFDLDEAEISAWEACAAHLAETG